MEVHHHPAAIGSHTAKKKWTHYFWEFLMLFLAVFCGFMAENQREHYIEKHREKQFVKSLVNDLRLDTAWLRTVTQSVKARMANLDSAIITLAHLEKNEIPLQTYRQLRRAVIQIMYFPNNGTITQLKNSGGMRLISKRDAVDSIENYDRFIKRLEVRRDVTLEMNRDFVSVLNKAVSGKDLFFSFYDSSFYGNKISQHFIALDSRLTNELINHCVNLRIRAVSDTVTNLQVKTFAVRQINYFTDVYHLK